MEKAVLSITCVEEGRRGVSSEQRGPSRAAFCVVARMGMERISAGGGVRKGGGFNV
jgi:hypothetical protein